MKKSLQHWGHKHGREDKAAVRDEDREQAQRCLAEKVDGRNN